ncbi:MAG: DUF4381 domain-containing protein [Gammaproteobacteria bacterium]|nr:DUF4381 domain-containing protein [Gammaproteobacteria bacterium]
MNQLELRDIHLPDASLWWPLAPGWWLSLLLIALLAILLPRLLNWYRQKPLRRLSLEELARIRQAYKQGQSEKLVLNEVARLLRRITISYYGRNAAAAATGADWQRQLQRLSPQSGFSEQHLELLLRERYRPQCEFDIEQLLQGCESWLRALPRSSKHV